MSKSNHKTGKRTQKIQSKIYMDYASSVTPNPSSIHDLGVSAKRRLEDSRTKVAKVLDARPSEIFFTSGGTEGNNLAIQGVVLKFWEHNPQKVPAHIVTTNIEHPSVLDTCRILEARGLAELTLVPVSKTGIVDPKIIKKALKENTVLVSVMYANNEIGTVQPIREIAKEIRHFNKLNNKNIIFHTDAVQAGNYLDINVLRLGVDLLTLSGSKIEGAGSTGVLFKKNSISLAKVFGGGDQEHGLRPGTENTSEVSKFASGLEFAQKIKEKEDKRLTKLRDYFFEKLTRVTLAMGIQIQTNGDLENRLPNNINITIPNIPSDLLVIELSARGVYASSKSACKSGDGKVSHVIKAINEDIKETDGSLRFSFGRGTTKSDVDYTIKSLGEILTKLKKWYY